MSAIGERLRLLRHLLGQRRWSCLLVAWGVTLIGCAVVVLLPDSYESAARVYADTGALPGPHAGDPTTAADRAGQLEAVRQALTGRPELEAAATAAGLAAPETSPEARERVMSRLAERLEIETQGWNLFRIAYRDRDPAAAERVVTALLERLAARVRGSGREDAETARHLLEQQIAAQARMLDEADRELAALHEQHPDLLLGEPARLARLEQARQQASEALGDLEATRAARAALHQQLAILPAMLLVAGPTPARSPATAGSAAELAALERKLDDLRTRYTERHPDVIATRRAIEALRARPAASERDEPRVRVPNPTHEQLRVQLAQKEAEIASLEARAQQAEALVARLADRAQPMPELEVRHRRLLREHAIVKQGYDELVVRREQARIAASLEVRGDGRGFRVIDPPYLPVEPASPPRLLLLAGVLATAALAGVVHAVGRGAGRAPFLTVARLERVYASRVLGSLSAVPVPVPAGRGRARVGGSRGAELGFVLGAAALVALVGGVALAEVARLTGPLRATVLQELIGRDPA